MSQTATRKQVHVLNRYDLKNGLVVYTVRSSNGTDTYRTTFLDGKATGCSCPATKPCYHMTQLQAREDARRIEVERKIEADLALHIEESLQTDPWFGMSQEERENARCTYEMSIN